MSTIPGGLDWSGSDVQDSPRVGARIVGVASRTPAETYSQEEVLAWFGEVDPKVRRMFLNSHIDQRGLYLPPIVDGCRVDETHQELLDKHLRGTLELGPAVVEEALASIGAVPADLDFLICVTSTGFLCPGLSARLIQAMGLSSRIQRLDVVGMGCNAAVNALQVAAHTAQGRPGSIGLVLCAEICSAAYVVNASMSTAVVNSLFGDGVVAAVIRADGGDSAQPGPRFRDFESFIHTETIEHMKYTLEDTKLSFFLHKEIPWVIGDHAHIPVGHLLSRHGLAVDDIDHWVIHSGGKKVIDAISRNLGLSEYHVRHTRGVLRDHGNMSSGSVLFSLGRLMSEDVVAAGDLGVMMAMGPGMSIETALMEW
jgi:predicted naringenin-chalcone synthase